MHDAISTIIFWRHIWRQKSSQTLCLQSHAQLQLLSFHMIRYNFLIKARFDIYYLVPCLASGIIQSYLSYILWKVERLQAELVQVSKGKKMQQIFDVGHMAPENEARHCICFSRTVQSIQCFHCFLPPLLSSRSWQTYYIQSITQMGLGPGQSWVEPVLVKFYKPSIWIGDG